MYQSTALIATFSSSLRCISKKAPLREQWSLDGSFAVLLDGLVPWQNVVEVLWMPLNPLRNLRGQMVTVIRVVPQEISKAGCGDCAG